MFFTLSTPATLRAERLIAVRRSLNSPVVSTEELPVGPARAVLAVHSGDSGRPEVVVAVRSLRAARTVAYGWDGTLAGDATVAVAIDAALSFGEAMGFLFDEDPLRHGADADARERALALWLEVTGGDGADAAPEGEPLLLEDLVEPEASARGRGLEVADPIDAGDAELERAIRELDDRPVRRREEPPAAAVAAPPQAVPLTKFRASPEASSPPDEASNDLSQRGAALGRVRLVKRRSVPARRPKLSPILRLLASF